MTVDGRVETNPATDVDEARPYAWSTGARWSRSRTSTTRSTSRSESYRRRTTRRAGPTVDDLARSDARLYPVGRLDVDSTGLILLTNDGEIANRLMHPRYEVPKTYRVAVRGAPSQEDLRALRHGIELEDGPTAPARVDVVEQRGKQSLLDMTIHEGRKRIVRRMLEAVGHPAIALERTAIGPLRLGRLAPGSARRLRPGRGRPRCATRRASATLAIIRARERRPDKSACSRCAARSPSRRTREQAILTATARAAQRESSSATTLGPDQMVSCLFSCTTDLNAQFPAVAARDLGIDRVPLLCTQEIEVPGALPRVIRVLLHYYAPAEHVPAARVPARGPHAARRPGVAQ